MDQFSTFRKVMAWSVHAFTASGILFAFLAILAVQAHDYKAVFIYLGIAFGIDAIDGTLARAAEVKKVLPHFNGESIDHVIDFTTYAVIHAYFIYTTQFLPPSLYILGIGIILLAACYYYGKQTYITPDLYFEGFVSYRILS